MTDLKKRLRELKRRCTVHNHPATAIVKGGEPVKPSRAVGHQRKPRPKPTLVVDNETAEPPMPAPSVKFASVFDYPLPDFVFQPLKPRQWQLPQALQSKGRYIGGGHVGTSVGFI